MAVTSKNMNETLQRIQSAPRWGARPTLERDYDRVKRWQEEHEQKLLEFFEQGEPKKPLLIGLGYKMGSGKDTVANHLAMQHGFVKVGFADAVRDAMWQIDPELPELAGEIDKTVRYRTLWDTMGYEALKADRWYGPEIRRLLQGLGEGMRFVDPDVWVRILESRIYEDVGDNRDIVISDMRYPNEAAMVKSQGGYTVRIHRPGATTNQHPSENALNGARFDHTIPNDSTKEDLRRLTDRLVERLRNGGE